MNRKDIEEAVSNTDKLLRTIPPDKRALAFPVVLDRVLAAKRTGVLEEQPHVPRKGKAPARKVTKKKLTRADLLRTMVSSGWFKKRRRIGEIGKELRRRGMKTARTSLPALLLPMVLEGVLEREHDSKGIYVYLSK